MTRDPITISLLGEPVAFARSRISRGGTLYTPAPQRNTMAALRMAAQQAMDDSGQPPFDEPLSLALLAEFTIPGSWSGKKRTRALLGELWPGKRPDIDNLYKLAADAFNSVVYRDDALIVDCRMRKCYGAQPKIVVTVVPVSRCPWGNRAGELPLREAAA